jgi:transposase-like protein
MNQERAKHWQEIITRQRKSGLSIKAFCRQESLCPHTLYQWRRRLKKGPPVSFAVVEVKPQAVAGAMLEVILSSGDRLQIPAGLDAETLRTVVAALRERA